jgi:hypothetical protein
MLAAAGFDVVEVCVISSAARRTLRRADTSSAGHP